MGPSVPFSSLPGGKPPILGLVSVSQSVSEQANKHIRGVKVLSSSTPPSHLPPRLDIAVFVAISFLPPSLSQFLAGLGALNRGR